MIGKALLPVARSGKVKAGQKVNIRLQNFPENEYGILRGTVKNISLTPAQSGEMSYYTVNISLLCCQEYINFLSLIRLFFVCHLC